MTGTGGIAGTGTLTKTGNGTVTLTTQNTYTGATTVSDGVLELDHDATGNQVLTATSGVSVAAPATLRLTRDDGAITFNRNISGPGLVEVNPHSASGGVVAKTVSLTGDNSGFTGTLRLLSPITGTYRVQSPTVAQLGSSSIEVQNGAQIYISAAGTYTNNLTITGTGFADSAGNIGALRLDAGAVWAGTIVVNGAARIGSHNSTGTISGSISGGDLEFGATNFNNGYTTILTGLNTYGLTTIGGQNTQVAAVPTMRLNIGNGGTTGTLGAGNVIINGDGANGVLGFDRSNGYTLLPGQTITGATGLGTIANSITRTFIDLDTLGAGFDDNGNTITLGAAAPTSGGNIRIGVTRANAVANIRGTLTSETINVSNTLSGATLNINAGAIVSANFLQIGVAANASGVINQTGGDVNVLGQVRAGHFGTLTATYNISGGNLTLTGASPNLTPSTAAAGGANATGDNNINGGATATIHGGGIYLGIDGTGILNHTGGTVTTNWIVLDNRGDTTGAVNMDGIDKYNISGAGSVLALRSNWGLIQRNSSSLVTFGGGTVRVDNSGTGTGTGANIVIPLDATIDTVASTTTNLDTNAAINTGNGFTLLRDVRGTGTLNLTGGGTVNVSTAGNQVIAANLTGGTNLTKLGAGATSLTGTASGYTGSVTVSQGRLNVANSIAAGSISVADGAALGGEPTTTNVNLGSATGSTLFFNAATAGALTATNLVLAGTTTIDLSTAPTGAGPFTVLNYTNVSGGLSFALANAASYRPGTSIDTSVAGTVTLNTVTKALTYTAAGGTTWNVATTNNWLDTSPAPDVFFAGDTVTFPELGASQAVTVTSGVSPWKTSVTAATTAYTLTSTTNGIAGPGNLEKSGGSTLTLVGPNTYSGQTVITAGTLSIAAANSLGNASTTNTIALSGGARLSYSGTTALDLGATRSLAVGSGGGTVAHTGTTAATLTLSGNISGNGDLKLSTTGTNAAVSTTTTYNLSGDNSGYTGNIIVEATGNILSALNLPFQMSVPNAASITINYPAGSVTAGNTNSLNLSGLTLPAGTTLNMTSFVTPGNVSLRSQVFTTGASVINGPITIAGTSIIQLNAAQGGSLTYNGPISETTPGAFVESTSPVLPFSNVLFLRGLGLHVINQPINLPSTGSTVAVTDGATAVINSTGNVFKSANSAFGTLRIGANDALPTTARLVIGQAPGDNAATFDLNGFNQTVAGLEWQAVTGNLLTKGISNSHPTATSIFTVNQATAPLASFNGTISGRVNFVKEGAANTTLLAAVSNFTGNVTVNAGTLIAATAGVANGATGTLGAVNLVGKTVTVNSPGTLSFTTNNIFGNGVANANLPALIVSGTVVSTRYNVLGNVTLNGGTLTQASTDAVNYEGFQFRGNVTVGGSTPSTIATTNGKADHLGANTIFNVLNVTGDAATDLTISAPLRDQSGDFALAAGGLTKTGNGTLTLSGAQNYATLTTSNGTTNVDGAFTNGTSTVNANATTNFTVSQSIGSLIIGDGAVVTLGSPAAAPPAALIPDDAGFGVASAPSEALVLQGVPEPGSAMLLFGGVLTLLGLRRRA